MAKVTDDQKLQVASQLFGESLLAELLQGLDTASKGLDELGVESKAKKETDADEKEAPSTDEAAGDEEGDEEDTPAARFAKSLTKAMSPLVKEITELKGLMHLQSQNKEAGETGGLTEERLTEILAENNKQLATAFATAMAGTQVNTVKEATSAMLEELASMTASVKSKTEKAKSGTEKAKGKVEDKSDKAGAQPMGDFFNFALHGEN